MTYSGVKGKCRFRVYYTSTKRLDVTINPDLTQHDILNHRIIRGDTDVIWTLLFDVTRRHLTSTLRLQTSLRSVGRVTGDEGKITVNKERRGRQMGVPVSEKVLVDEERKLKGPQSRDSRLEALDG